MSGTEMRIPAREIREGDLIVVGPGTRRRVVERNEQSALNHSMREVRVRGADTCHYPATELVTVWRDWGFPQ